MHEAYLRKSEKLEVSTRGRAVISAMPFARILAGSEANDSVLFGGAAAHRQGRRGQAMSAIMRAPPVDSLGRGPPCAPRRPWRGPGVDDPPQRQIVEQERHDGRAEAGRDQPSGPGQAAFAPATSEMTAAR